MDGTNCRGASFDFIVLLYWFPVATDQIMGLSLKVDQGLKQFIRTTKRFNDSKYYFSGTRTTLSGPKQNPWATWP